MFEKRKSIDLENSRVFCTECLTRLPEKYHEIAESKKWTHPEKAFTYAPFVQFKTCYNYNGKVHLITTTPAQNFPGPYKQTLEFTPTNFTSTCTCPEQSNCKHVYAVLINIEEQTKMLKEVVMTQGTYHISRNLIEEYKQIEENVNNNPLTPLEFEKGILPQMNVNEMRSLLGYLVVQCPDTCKYIQLYRHQEPGLLVTTKPYRVYIERAFEDHTWFNYDIKSNGFENNFKDVISKLITALSELRDKAFSYIDKDPMNSFILLTMMQEEVSEERFIGNGEEEYLCQTEAYSQFIDDIREKCEIVESKLNEDQIRICLDHLEREK